MIQTTALQFAYHQAQKFCFPDIALEDRAHLLILGASGIGKTTLLHLIAGLLKPSSGSIIVQHKDISQLSDRELDRFRGQQIGLVFQRPHFISALTLQENLLLVQHLAGKKQCRERVSEVLSRLGLAHKLQQKPQHLSQGEQQRAAIAIALINQPSLILADEPTSSLDDTNCLAVATLLKKQAEATGANLIVITHDQRLQPYFQQTLTL